MGMQGHSRMRGAGRGGGGLSRKRGTQAAGPPGLELGEGWAWRVLRVQLEPEAMGMNEIPRTAEVVQQRVCAEIWWSPAYQGSRKRGACKKSLERMVREAGGKQSLRGATQAKGEGAVQEGDSCVTCHEQAPQGRSVQAEQESICGRGAACATLILRGEFCLFFINKIL